MLVTYRRVRKSSGGNNNGSHSPQVAASASSPAPPSFSPVSASVFEADRNPGAADTQNDRKPPFRRASTGASQQGFEQRNLNSPAAGRKAKLRTDGKPQAGDRTPGSRSR